MSKVTMPDPVARVRIGSIIEYDHIQKSRTQCLKGLGLAWSLHLPAHSGERSDHITWIFDAWGPF